MPSMSRLTFEPWIKQGPACNLPSNIHLLYTHKRLCTPQTSFSDWKVIELWHISFWSFLPWLFLALPVSSVYCILPTNCAAGWSSLTYFSLAWSTLVTKGQVLHLDLFRSPLTSVQVIIVMHPWWYIIPNMKCMCKKVSISHQSYIITQCFSHYQIVREAIK